MPSGRSLPLCVDSVPTLEAIAAEMISQAHLAPGARVLDACCGTGSAALAAAESVGPFGCVVALGCDQRAIDGGRSEAVRLGLGNVSFIPSGFEALDELPETFDAVVCACANLDRPEMLIRHLWHWVRVDGQLMINTIATGVEPGHSALVQALGAGRSVEGVGEFSTVDGLSRLLAITGAESRSVEVQTRELSFHSIDHWWTGILAPTYHPILSSLAADEAARVREATLENISQKSWQKARVNILSGVAWKRTSSAPAA